MAEEQTVQEKEQEKEQEQLRMTWRIYLRGFIGAIPDLDGRGPFTFGASEETLVTYAVGVADSRQGAGAIRQPAEVAAEVKRIMKGAGFFMA